MDRRDFLKAGGVALAGTLAGVPPAAATPAAHDARREARDGLSLAALVRLRYGVVAGWHDSGVAPFFELTWDAAGATPVFPATPQRRRAVTRILSERTRFNRPGPAGRPAWHGAAGEAFHLGYGFGRDAAGLCLHAAARLASFDCVFAAHELPGAARPAADLAELRGLFRPGGVWHRFAADFGGHARAFANAHTFHTAVPDAPGHQPGCLGVGRVVPLDLGGDLPGLVRHSGMHPTVGGLEFDLPDGVILVAGVDPVRPERRLGRATLFGPPTLHLAHAYAGPEWVGGYPAQVIAIDITDPHLAARLRLG